MRGGSNRLLSPQEVAERIGVSRKTVDRHWQEWGLRRRPVGRLVKFPERDVENYINGGTQHA